MTAGRKPLPTAIKELNGNPGKRALNREEPRPVRPRRVPPPPEHLRGLAKTKWQKIAAQLHRMGVLTEVDQDALARYCITYKRWREAEKQVERDGEVILTTNGNQVQNPYLSIANRCMAQLNSLGSEFGLTPSSRAKVHAEPPPDESALEKKLFGKNVKVKG
jgi:P27 family predicted phage terminase small subunit